MARYRCTQDFELDAYDGDGFCTEETVSICAGDIFQAQDTDFRLVGGSNTIRLENAEAWMEITPDYLEAFFEKIEEE